jgi:hypothetical protein
MMYQESALPPSERRAKREFKRLTKDAAKSAVVFGAALGVNPASMPVKNEQLNTIMDSKNKNLRIGNAKKVEKYIK